MSRRSEINYIDNSEYLDPGKVSKISHEVICSHWKFPGKAPAEFKLDINVVSAEEITVINREYLGRDKPTDVIVFSFMEGEKTPIEKIPLIGQIIISRDAVRSQAVEYGNSESDEMLLLLIHGLLHVAGWPEGEEIKECQEKIKNRVQAHI
ncbi:MAG: rRNA maturation RNase YbeY [Elusimicrobiota bacterium]